MIYQNNLIQKNNFVLRSTVKAEVFYNFHEHNILHFHYCVSFDNIKYQTGKSIQIAKTCKIDAKASLNLV